MKKTTVCLLILIAAGLIVSIGIVSAFGVRFLSEENGSAIKQAIESNDFNAWKNAIMATLTQENFNKLVERQKTMSERKQLIDAVKQAIKDGNYEAYKKAVENLMGSYKVMSEDDFNAMVHRYNTTESGMGFGYPMRGFGRHFMHW